MTIRGRWWAALVVGALAACGGGAGEAGDSTSTTTASDRQILFVDPAGTGTSCRATDVCGSLAAALSVADPGALIELAPGEYPPQLYIGPEDGDPIDGDVEIVGGGRVELASVVVRAHRVVLRGIRVTGAVRTLREDAIEDFELRDSEIVGGVVLINGVRGAVVAGNEFHDGINTDALNVKDDSREVVVEDNTFVDYRHDPAAADADVHVDCIQVFGVTDVTIRANRFDNCAQRAIIIQVSPLTSLGTVGVTVENNVIGDCDEQCQTEDVPFQATGPSADTDGDGGDYRIVNNLIDGFAYIDRVDGLVFANNVLDRYFNTDESLLVCSGAGVGPNLVSEPGRCGAVTAPDRVGTMQFDSSPYRSEVAPTVRDAGGFGFADAAVAPATDIFGRAPCGSRDVGPYEFGCG